MPGPFHQEWPAVVVAASGPSFSAEQAATIEAAQAAGRVRVLAVGYTGATRLPSCDAVYAADGIFWRNYFDDVRARCPAAQLWTQDQPSAKNYGLRRVEIERGIGLCKRLDRINNGGNSGYSAIGLAYLFGARRIVLVGFDMQRTGGRTHHFGEHIGRGPLAGKMHNSPDAAYRSWAPRFAPLAADLTAAGVTVVNCTAETALHCFPRAELAATLGGLPCSPA